MTPTPEMVAMAERIADSYVVNQSAVRWRIAKRAALTAIMEVWDGTTPTAMNLSWTEPAPPNGETHFYDHCTAQSPLGEYTIDWKSWKDYPGYVVCLNGDFIVCDDTLEAAKATAQKHFEQLVLSCLTPSATGSI